jgi:hypothetical protein
MRLLGIAIVLVPSLAAASPPITAGVSLGVAQTSTEADAGVDPNTSLGLFGRIAISQRVAAQLDVGKVSSGPRDTVTTRIATVLLAVDLADRGAVIPVLFGGAGIDRAATADGFETASGHHFEAGLALEYRSPSGFVIGADARIGQRTLDSQMSLDEPVLVSQPFIPITVMKNDDYRAVRATFGVRF